MNPDRDYLAAGLALGGLDEDDLAQARTLADTDAEFRAEVDAYADTLALMAMSDDPQPVSEETRSAILSLPDAVMQEDGAAEAGVAEARSVETRPVETRSAEAGGADSTSSARDTARGPARGPARDDAPIDLEERRRRRQSWLPWAAAAAAIVVIAGFGVTTWQSQQRQNELEERLAQTQQQLEDTSRLMGASDLKTSTAELADGGSVTVVSSEAEQLIRVSSHGVEASAGTSLQMWVIDAAGPKSAGLMIGDVASISDSRFTAGSQFGITVEPEGGSDQPTSDPVVAVEL